MTEIIVYKIVTFVLMMLLGVISAKTGILKRESLSTLSGLLVRITFPCLGFALIYNADTSLTDFVSNGAFIFFELLLSAFLLIVGILSMKIMRLPNATKQIHVIQTMFGNQGFINIPILLSIFTNGEASVYIAIFTLVDQILLWSLGVIIMSTSSPDTKGVFSADTLKKILNPMNISMLLAVVFTTFHISLPNVVADTITSVGNTCFSLAMIFLGATLSYVSLKDMNFIYDYIFLVVVKMLIIPIGVAAVVSYFLSPIETTILTFMTCMPAMSAVPMMAQTYHSDSEFASKTCLVMTVCSMFTIPLVFFILEQLGIAIAFYH